MAIVSAEELVTQVIQLYTGTDYFYALLVNDQGSILSETTSLEEVLVLEQDEDIGAYVRKELIYTSADINAYSGGVSLVDKRALFTHSGTPSTVDWTITHVAVVRAPASRSSTNVLPVLSTFDMSATGTDIASDSVAVSTIANFTDGDAVVIITKGGSVLPSGLESPTSNSSSPKLYIKKGTGNSVQFYSDALLTTLVDITAVSTGVGYIKNATGNLVGLFEPANSITVSATQSVTFDININQGQ